MMDPKLTTAEMSALEVSRGSNLVSFGGEMEDEVEKLLTVDFDLPKIEKGKKTLLFCKIAGWSTFREGFISIMKRFIKLKSIKFLLVTNSLGY